jgi:hypothetical protein
MRAQLYTLNQIPIIPFSAEPIQFDALSSGYRLEIERMQAEVLDYLLRPLTIEPDKQIA